MASATHLDLIPPADPGGRIVRVDDDLRTPAVARLVAGGDGVAMRSHAERFLAFSRANDIRIDAMWATIDGAGRISATVLAVPNPGRTATLFTSAPTTRSAAAEHAILVDHACRELPALDVDLAQALIAPGEGLQRDAFAEAGFRELAHLSYMERPVPAARAIEAPVWPDGAVTQPYRDELRDDLLAILEASYEQTRDCPDLRGLRRTEDILAGHRGSGIFAPELWTLLWFEGRPAGAILLNPAPANRTIELVYVGLARAARGKGLGRALLRHGLNLVAGRAERTITLAVDEQNEPAISLYRGEGFRRVLRRVALIRSIQI